MPAQNRERIDKERTYYHIYNKGVEQRIIFNDEEDYRVFTSYLEDYLGVPKERDAVKTVFKIKGKTFQGTPHQHKNYFQKVELIAYSLKPNHFHLLIHQVTSGSQEKFIRSLATRYSIYFNKKYHRSGSLFDGPYKSIPIDKEGLLAYLTYYFHKASNHSSYLEYVGMRDTSWVKPQVVMEFFKSNVDSYKHFIENHSLEQKEKVLIDSVNFGSDIDCMERRDLTSSKIIPKSSTKKSLPKVFGFFTTSFMVFLLLFGLGLKNISTYGYYDVISPVSEVLPARTEQLMPSPASSELDPTKEIKSEVIPEVGSIVGTQAAELIEDIKLKSLVTIILDDPSSTVNIRQKPATDSAKIGSAFSGQTFESIKNIGEWYEIKLTDKSTGFISAEYIK